MDVILWLFCLLALVPPASFPSHSSLPHLICANDCVWATVYLTSRQSFRTFSEIFHLIYTVIWFLLMTLWVTLAMTSKQRLKYCVPGARRRSPRQNTGVSRSPLSVAEMQADGWDNYLKPEEDSHAVRRMKKHYNRLKMSSGGPQGRHTNRKRTKVWLSQHKGQSISLTLLNV